MLNNTLTEYRIITLKTPYFRPLFISRLMAFSLQYALRGGHIVIFKERSLACRYLYVLMTAV